VKFCAGGGMQATGLSNEMSQILTLHSLVTAQPMLMKLETFTIARRPPPCQTVF